MIPRRVTGAHYFQLLFSSEWYLKVFWNSLFLTAIITAGQIIASVILGYVLTCIRFIGKKILFFLLIVIVIMPFQVTLLPNFLMAQRLNILDSWWSLILPSWFSPMGPLLICWFIRGLPEEMIDAAMLDTNSIRVILGRFVVPNISYGIIALGLLSFAQNWSMIEQPIVLIQSKSLYPVSLALESIRENSPGLFHAGAVLYATPVVILYSFCKDSLLEGIGGESDENIQT